MYNKFSMMYIISNFVKKKVVLYGETQLVYEYIEKVK